MSGRKSRSKGHGYERAIAIKFKEHGFPEAKRKLEYQNESKGRDWGYDIEGVGALRPQAKSYKKYVSVTKIEEVKVEKKFIPCLVTKGDYKPDVICFYADDFGWILKNHLVIWRGFRESQINNMANLCIFDVRLISIEIVQGKRYAPVERLKKVKAKRGTIACLVSRVDGKRSIAMLYLKDFFLFTRSMFQIKNLTKPDIFFERRPSESTKVR